MKRSLLRVTAVVGGAVLLLAGAGIGVGESLADHNGKSSTTPVLKSADGAAPAGSDALATAIAGLQAGLKTDPTNAANWASLGLYYVQQAKITVNPAYYPKADGALATSLRLQPVENFLADGGMAALTAARHDFVAAQGWAQKGLAVDPYNSTLYGALDDADTQLGLYPQAFAAVQKMLNVRPGTPSFSRAEYVFELQGDIPAARGAMQKALEAAPTPADAAFAYTYLGQLDFDNGDPKGALTEVAKGAKADPTYSALLAVRAKAEAALGQTSAAISDYAQLVNDVPQPEYVVEYGELLQSLGRTADANAQYQVFLAEEKLFESNGVALDTDPTLFYADHGDPATALRYGEAGIKIRPFIEMDDALAWALHVNHRDTDALAYEQRAMALGTRNALFRFHLGMIDLALGDRAAARTALTAALALNPHFNPLLAPEAQKTLASLGGPS